MDGFGWSNQVAPEQLENVVGVTKILTMKRCEIERESLGRVIVLQNWGGILIDNFHRVVGAFSYLSPKFLLLKEFYWVSNKPA